MQDDSKTARGLILGSQSRLDAHRFTGSELSPIRAMWEGRSVLLIINNSHNSHFTFTSSYPTFWLVHSLIFSCSPPARYSTPSVQRIRVPRKAQDHPPLSLHLQSQPQSMSLQSKANNEEFRKQSSAGTVPDSKLFVTFKMLKEPRDAKEAISDGILPVRWLDAKFKVAKRANIPSSVGICPVSMLSYKEKRPNAEEIVPVR